MQKLFFTLLTLLITNNISAQQSSNCACDYTINNWYWKFDGANVGNLPNVTIHDPAVAALHPQ